MGIVHDDYYEDDDELYWTSSIEKMFATPSQKELQYKNNINRNKKKEIDKKIDDVKEEKTYALQMIIFSLFMGVVAFFAVKIIRLIFSIEPYFKQDLFTWVISAGVGFYPIFKNDLFLKLFGSSLKESNLKKDGRELDKKFDKNNDYIDKLRGKRNIEREKYQIKKQNPNTLTYKINSYFEQENLKKQEKAIQKPTKITIVNRKDGYDLNDAVSKSNDSTPHLEEILIEELARDMEAKMNKEATIASICSEVSIKRSMEEEKVKKAEHHTYESILDEVSKYTKENNGEEVKGTEQISSSEYSVSSILKNYSYEPSEDETVEVSTDSTVDEIDKICSEYREKIAEVGYSTDEIIKEVKSSNEGPKLVLGKNIRR